jgi:HEPN domain-containing protein
MRPERKISQRFENLVSEGGKLREQMPREQFVQWITEALSIVERVFGRESPHHQHLSDAYQTFKHIGLYNSSIGSARGALQAAADDYNGGYLFRTRTLLRAELSEDVLEQAEELLSHGYKDPACVLAGVTLEVALKDLCEREDIERGKLDKMNADLTAREVYNKGMQKQITAWAHRRNKAAHGEWHEYNESDVREMISGVRRFVSEYL